MDSKTIVKLARKIIERHLRGSKREKIKLEGRGGIFVTLHKNGELRGCIGIPTPGRISERLEAAALGVIDDPRFPKLELSEMDEVIVEVSVLTESKIIADPKQVVVGKDGIIVRRGFRSGLLLPQVPVEQKWNLEEYLDYGCLKAGISPGAWKDSKTEIFVFQAKVFKETEPKGEVIEVTHQNG